MRGLLRARKDQEEEEEEDQLLQPPPAPTNARMRASTRVHKTKQGVTSPPPRKTAALAPIGLDLEGKKCRLLVTSRKTHAKRDAVWIRDPKARSASLQMTQRSIGGLPAVKRHAVCLLLWANRRRSSLFSLFFETRFTRRKESSREDRRCEFQNK